MNKYIKGKFKPKNSNKYMGDPTKIVYRSRWELVFMKWCDNNTNVLAWASEEIAIAYKSPIDNKIHKYFPDFIIRLKKKNTIETMMIEIKPFAQTKPPSRTNIRSYRYYLNEVKTWGINEAKWKYAQEYCKNKGWNFSIITENELGIKNGR